MKGPDFLDYSGWRGLEGVCTVYCGVKCWDMCELRCGWDVWRETLCRVLASSPGRGSPPAPHRLIGSASSDKNYNHNLQIFFLYFEIFLTHIFNDNVVSRHQSYCLINLWLFWETKLPKSQCNKHRINFDASITPVGQASIGSFGRPKAGFDNSWKGNFGTGVKRLLHWEENHFWIPFKIIPHNSWG